MKKALIFSTLLISLSITAQNVGINATGATPVTSAALDIDMVNKGLLIPRVALTATSLFSPVTGTATASLMVYNTATTGTVPTNVTPGYYYWNGTIWVRFINSGGGGSWELLGNAGTSIATNFIGTTDNVSLAIRSNNLERMRVLNTGEVVINSAVYLPGDRLSVYATGSDYAVNGYTSGLGVAGYFNASGTGNAGEFETTGSGDASRFNILTPTGLSAGRFVTSANSVTPTVVVTNSSTSNNSDGIEISLTGSSAKRGIDMYLSNVTNTGIGLAVFQDGLGRVGNFQNSNTANTDVTLFANHAGNGRVGSFQNSLATSTVQVGFFSQASTGNVVATYQNAAAVWGQSLGIRSGVFLVSATSDNTTALYANYNGGGNNDAVGVMGVSAPAVNFGYGVVGIGNYYGVYSNGTFGGTGAKSFQIDHPLDPENKYLRHYSLESPEVLNLYRGNVLLNENGEAIITMPNYFHEINIDFSYVLTPIGAPANLYVKTEVQPDGKFVIAGGNPGMKVSWYVYAERNDLYIRTYPEQTGVEIEKKQADKGLYLRPEIYGQPEEKGIFYRNQSTNNKSLETAIPIEKQAVPVVEKKRK